MNQITWCIKCIRITDTRMNLRTCNKVDTMLRMHLLMNHITRHSNRIRVDTVDTGVKVDTVDTKDTVDTVMSLVTHHCMMIMNHVPRAIRFKYMRMFIDVTYKTNIYNMPFVQVVGLTLTNKSFCVAHAAICKERRDNFVWVLELIKSMLHECMMPRVVVANRELAIINACAKVFPNASRLLCQFHMEQNICKHCKQGFNKLDWEKFMSYWRRVCESASEPMYKYNLEKLYNRLVVANRESKCSFNKRLTQSIILYTCFYISFFFAGVFNYVYENWLKEYKEMFVYAWTISVATLVSALQTELRASMQI
ncbi:putative MULE transposase domain, FHY3/FAR1 family [Helianthus anomalus]